ncbi:MAG: arsenite methyltransferase [Candidatus Krumholzibacteria bacterium]
MKQLKDEDLRRAVRKSYGDIAEAGGAGCDGAEASCCGPVTAAESISVGMGYSSEEVAAVPEGSNLGLGCGNPQAIAVLRSGETVVDLGSGAGFDCFLAARAVGENGHVIGVDMTPEMIGKARENAVKGGFENVEFRLGEIERVPVADDSIDVIISNCVINLSPDKTRVFEEAFRVLKPGGRLAVSDVVATAELPDEVKKDLALYTGCVAGAEPISQLKTALAAAGFTDIRIEPLQRSKEIIREWAPGKRIEDLVVSASIEAVKP